MTRGGDRSRLDQALRTLREALRNGRYPVGTRIPAEPRLQQELGIGRNTIREAVAVLEQEGWLRRVQGSGTRVLALPPANPVRTCLLLTRTVGDVYERQSHRLINGLEGRGVMPMVVNIGQRQHDDHAHAQACLDYALAHRLDGIIVDTPPPWFVDRCARAGGACPPVMAINACDHPGELPVRQVLADYRTGARLATEHLRRLGHDQILCVMHRNEFLKPGQTIEDAAGVYGDIIHGYLDGLEGLAPRYLLLRREFLAADEIRELQAALRSRHRPTAVFAVGDYRAKVVIDVARRQGLRVPDDLAVVGYYDTPWATLMEPPLTSVSLNMDDVADLAVDVLFGPVAPVGPAPAVTVPPELVVRDTCGQAARQVTGRARSAGH